MAKSSLSKKLKPVWLLLASALLLAQVSMLAGCGREDDGPPPADYYTGPMVPKNQRDGQGPQSENK